KLRLIKPDVEQLPEYREFQGEKKKYEQRIKDRKKELWPTVEKRLIEASKIKPDIDFDEYDVKQIEGYQATVHNLQREKDKISDQLKKLSNDRRTKELHLVDKISQEQSNLNRVEDLDRKLFDEKQALSIEVNAKSGRVSVVQYPVDAERVATSSAGAG